MEKYSTMIRARFDTLGTVLLLLMVGGAVPRPVVADDSVRATSAPSGSPGRLSDDLIDAGLAGPLSAYLEDLDAWILPLDVGSNALKNTKDTATSIFINGNFARVLLASHRITGRRDHLDEAIRWCDTFCDQQQAATTSKGEPAGFWADLGPGGNIYFGDAGTAATALAVAYRFVDDDRKVKYLRAMENMARFVMDGCAADPQGRNREATASWVSSFSAPAAASSAACVRRSARSTQSP